MKINEFTKKPRKIKNPDRYMKRLAKRGKLTREYKYQNVNAHVATPKEIGKEVITYKKDPAIFGTDRKNIEATRVPVEGDYIVNNVQTPWQVYVVDAKTFNKKYRPSDDEENVFIPKGEDMLMSPALRRGVEFYPKNWGGYKASVDKGGRMVQSTTNPSDIYPIKQSDHDGTYRNVKYRVSESSLNKMVKESVLTFLRNKDIL